MYVGVDITRGGWVFCLTDGRKVFFELSSTFRPHPFPTLVDVPIGLPKDRERKCDAIARKILSKRASTVFPVPCRDAVYQRNYERALRVNRKIQGKGFSRQFWNLVTRVREVDRFLRRKREYIETVKESHPEICFLFLKKGPLPSKHTVDGVRVRLEILERYLKSSREKILKFHEVTKVPIHDLIDACVLAISQIFKLRSIPEEPEYDEYGLPMCIFYPVVEKPRYD